MNHCGKMQEKNRSVRKQKIESGHSIDSFEGIESGSHDLVVELRMYSLTLVCEADRHHCFKSGHIPKTEGGQTYLILVTACDLNEI